MHWTVQFDLICLEFMVALLQLEWNYKIHLAEMQSIPIILKEISISIFYIVSNVY